MLVHRTRKKTSILGKNSTCQLSVLCILGLVVLTCILLMGCGESSSEKGTILSKKAYEYLINEHKCINPNDCPGFQIYGGYGDRINYTIYHPNDRKALAAYIQFIIENGPDITDGVPISIKVYPKSRGQYGIMWNVEPIIRIEVLK